MDKTRLGALRTQIEQASDRDVRVDEVEADTRVLSEIELSLASGGDDIPTW